MQGKSKLPEVEREFRNASRALLKKQELEEEFDALLSLTEDEKETEYGQAVLEVAEIRMDLAADIKTAIDDLAKAKSKADKTEKREAQKNLMEEFVALPDLGATFEDWEELVEQGGIKRSVGRPPVPFEVSLLRAREDAEQALGKYKRAAKKHGFPESLEDKSLNHPIPLDQMLELYKKATKNMGKSSNDELGVLDAEIRKMEARIEHITSGEAQREREEKLKSAKYSSRGTRLGRPFEPLEELLEKYETEKAEMEAKREKLESKLPPLEKMDRRIKIQEDQARDLRRLIRAEGWDPRSDDRDSMPYGDVLNRVELEIKKLKELRKKTESGVASAPDKRAEREIRRRVIMQEELNRQHEKDRQFRSGNAKEDLSEGLDQLAKEVGTI